MFDVVAATRSSSQLRRCVGRAAGTIDAAMRDGQLDGSEWSFGHVQHFHNVSKTSASDVGRLLRLPHDHTNGKEQKETGEKHREEYKQIDVQLILTKEYQTVTGRAAVRLQCDEESCRTQVVNVLRQCQHQPILEIVDAQHGVAFVQCDICAEIFGAHIFHGQTVQIEWVAVMCGAGYAATMRQRDVAVKTVVGKGWRWPRIDDQLFDQVRALVCLPLVFLVEIDFVYAGRFLLQYDQGVFLRAHVQVQLALRHIDNDTNVDVHEARLHHEEHRLARF